MKPNNRVSTSLRPVKFISSQMKPMEIGSHPIPLILNKMRIAGQHGSERDNALIATKSTRAFRRPLPTRVNMLLRRLMPDTGRRHGIHRVITRTGRPDLRRISGGVTVRSAETHRRLRGTRINPPFPSPSMRSFTRRNDSARTNATYYVRARARVRQRRK